FQLPADKAEYGSFTMIDDRLQTRLKAIVDGLPQQSADADTQKLINLYASYMDEGRLESLGAQPLQAQFAAIDAIRDAGELPALIAHLNRIGVGTPFAFAVLPDSRNSTQYAVSMGQSGLGMPDRDYYLSDETRMKEARDKYRAHIGRLLQLANDA